MWFTAWAITLTALLGALFVGVTVLTVALWSTDASYAETNPVVDLAFFALGGILVTLGVASQIRARRVAGLQQAFVALTALAVTGAVAGRVEPFVGGLVLLALAVPLAVLHPNRDRLLAVGAGLDRPLATLATIAMVPAMLYAAAMVTLARGSGPACFLGQCVQGDRYAQAGALAVALVAVALLAAARTPGWPFTARCAGAAAITMGVVSLALPDEVGALGTTPAVAALAWGCAVVAVALRRPGAPRASHQ